MAVAYDVSSAATAAEASSLSWTHTPVGTPRGVIVFCLGQGGSGQPAIAVTYGGVSMTAVTSSYVSDAAGELGAIRAFFLGASVPTGAQTVQVTTGNVPTVAYWAAAITVTAGGNTEYTGLVTLSGDQALGQQNVDDGSPGTNSVRFAGAYYGGSSPPTAGADSTSVQTVDFGTKAGGVVRETTAGQGSRPVGFNAASDDVAANFLAIREVASGTTFNQTVAPTATLSVTAVRSTGKIVAPTVGTTASAVRSVGKTVQVTTTGTVTVPRTIGKTVAATVAGTVALVASYTKNVTINAVATLTAALTSSKAYGRTIAATLGLTPTLSRTVGKSVATTVTGTPTIVRGMAKALAFTATLTGSALRQTTKTVAATSTDRKSVV